MEKNQVIEGNKIIALSEFCSDRVHDDWTIANHHGSLRSFYENLQFHASWDLLMPIVYKIGSLCDEREKQATDKDVWSANGWKTWSYQKCKFNGNLSNMTITKVWNTVVEFIKWFNTVQEVKVSDTTKMLS